MVGSTLRPPALTTISCLYAGMEIDGPHVDPAGLSLVTQHEPPAWMNATRSLHVGQEGQRKVSTSFTTASKRDSMALKTLFPSGSLLKKGAANFIHSARPSKPEKCGGDV